MASPSDTNNPENPSGNEPDASTQKVSHILDEVLEEPEEFANRHNRHPLVVDFLLAACLLATMGAFSAGLVKMYVSHSAEQSIIQRNYPAAITLLEGAPFPDLLVHQAPSQENYLIKLFISMLWIS